MTMLISRRSALFSSALSLASLAATGGSFARQRAPVSAVRVDVGPLRASGSTEFADWVAQMLPDELQKSLARQWAASGGGTVVAQINAVQLRVSGNRSAIGRSRAGSRNTRTDTIDGNLSLLDASGGTITRGDDAKPVRAPSELVDAISAWGQKGISLQRYKGLGEMNPEQLWETTLDENARSLLQVKISHGDTADEVFSKLMGDAVDPRREFIQDNALAVANLDV